MPAPLENPEVQRHADLLAYQAELSTKLTDSQFASSPYLQEAAANTLQAIGDLEQDPELLQILGSMVHLHELEVDLLTKGVPLEVVDEEKLKEVQDRSRTLQFQRAVTLFTQTETGSKIGPVVETTEAVGATKDRKPERRGEAKTISYGEITDRIRKLLPRALEILKEQGPLSIGKILSALGVEPSEFERKSLRIALIEAGVTTTGLKAGTKYFLPK